jgi:hypothetical protein
VAKDNPTADQGTQQYEQRLALSQARTKAYRWAKGTSGNPSGNSRFYYECRKIAQQASPDMMRGLVELANTAEDERVRSVCIIAVLDRAGIKPIEAAEMLEQLKKQDQKPQFDPRDYDAEKLKLLDAAFRLLVQRRDEKAAATIEDRG